MAVTVTKTTIAALNADQTFTPNVATVSTVNGTEVFTITPTKAGRKSAIVFGNANSHGAYTYSIAAGDFWASTTAITGSIAQNALEVIEVDSARILQDDGTIAITLTPATGKILKTNHVATIYALETL